MIINYTIKKHTAENFRMISETVAKYESSFEKYINTSTFYADSSSFN